VNHKNGLFSTFSSANHWENGTVPISRPSRVRGRLAPLSAVILAALFALALLGSASARADVVCPNPVPVVNENQCHGESGTSEWEVWDYSQELGGFPTKTSVNLGESVTLKIGRNGPVTPTKTVNISVYRMGYYEGLGGRLVNSAGKVTINNTFQCEAMNEVTGEVSCANWSPTYTIPASAFPSSGVYIAKLVASTGDETQIVFTVRDDSRQPKAEVLYVLPVATYEAYNIFGGKSLYYGTEGGNTVSGTSRAVKVSFQRPLAQVGAHLNWFTGPDIDLLQWLEKQGYDVAYTDDVQLQNHPEELLNHRVDVISGHSEYWSEGQFKGFLAAREAGVNIASFSANTAYWKVRYEDNNNTLVCYKTVEGSGSTGNGSVSENDWGPDGIKGTADDALGLDGKAGTADDNPQNSTTTFRDNGAPPGDPSAPPGGRVGPDMPENQLFGVMYVGDNDAQDYPITVPPGNANEEFATNRIWRNTGISGNSTTTIGSGLVGWEWDAIPTQAQYLSHEPKGVKSLYATNVQVSKTNSWIQDEGRLRNTEPPPGQPGTVGGVTYTAASGAEVFASGSMQWAYGLSSEADERIQQATYNIFSDMGVQPNTAEEGLHLDPAGKNRAPNGGFTISQNPAKTNTSITFDASASHDPDGTIAKYEWDLDGNGTYETNTGSKATVTHTYSAEGEYTVGLRVTDNGGATGTAVQTLTIINNLPPTASFTATPSVQKKGEPISFSAAGSSDPDGTIAKYEWDFDGNGTYETNGGSNPVISHSYTTPGTYTVGLRVTDNGGKTATTTRPISINSGEVSKYSDSVLATAGLAHYWRMGETSGTSFADSAGSSPAGTFGEPTLGVPGGVANDPDRAAEFDGVNDAAKAAIDLSGTHAVTVEFWLKWANYANDDRLAMEFTNNFNENPGGFLVDPNSPQFGGTFGVGIGQGTSRNTVYFERPTAGEWHHYAFVLDTSAPAAQEITPYVDGKAIAYEKGDSGTGAGNFANSTLNFMSRADNSLFGAGVLDEVAIYRRTLGPTTIADHYNAIVPTGGGEGGPEGGAGEGGKEETGGGKEETTGAGGEGPATYSQSILGTSTLLHYWRMGEAGGPSLADSKGTSTAAATGGPTFGVPGSLKGDANTAVRFDGVNDSVAAPLNLAGKSAITVEFWLKWNSYANDDRLAMEFTNNFNEAAGGFLVDPNAPQNGGTFGVGIGQGASRNNVFFARPTAGQWHHYAFVLDANAPAAQQITPYVDGKAVAYTKLDSGTGAGSFANSTLNLMSRAGSSLFGTGELDEVSVFGSALSAATVENNFKGIVPEGGGKEEKEETKEETGTPATYSDSVLGTPGLNDYWRLGEESGSVFADSVGPSPASIAGEPTLGVAGAINKDADKAARFDGINDSASAAVNLSGKSAITVEFWLKWNSYANNDALAMELTNNFNEADGGFLVDPNSSYGSFAVGIGRGASRNVTLFPRPSAGLWHHYAFVLNTTAPAAEEVVPYVDGEAVSFSKAENGTGGGNFANATLNFMSRAGAGLYGAGDLDEVALYDRALSPSTITSHYKLAAHNMPPEASLTATPNPAPTNTSVVFDASGSSDVDGTVAKYEWDLDGNGTYETNTGTTPTVTRSYSVPGDRSIGLRVTDAKGATGTTTRTVAIQNQLPIASFTATPNPVLSGVSTSFNASASKDPDGTIAKYEWDLDGNGTYETNTGTTPTASNTFATPGEKTVGLRVTDNFGDTATTTQAVTVENRAPTASFAATPNPVLSGVSTSFDASGSKDPDGTIAKYEWDLDGNGTYETDTGTTPTAGNTFATPGTKTVGLRVTDNSGATATTTVTVTVQNRAPSASITATPNPVVSGSNVTFDASGSKDSDGTIVEYEWDLDGNGTYETPGFGKSTTFVAYAKPGTRTVGVRVTDNSGATATASLTLTVQNRAPSASFTATPNPVSPNATTTFDASASKDPDGTIAKYEWDLDGNGTYETNTGTKATTTRSYTTEGTVNVSLRITDDSGATATTTVPVVVKNQAPTASFTATPNPANTNATVSFNAGASVDPDGTIAKYEWDLDGNGTYETNTGTTKTTSKTYATPGEVTIGLRVTDNKGATGTITKVITIQNQPPVPSFTVSPNPATAGSTVTFNGSASKDPDGTIAKYEWDLDGNGTYETNTGTTATTSLKYATATEPVVGLRVTDNRGATATTTKTLVVRGPYSNAVLGTSDLIDYWRLGEASGTSLVDSIGGRNATALNGVTLGTAGNLTLDPNTAAGFDGVNDAAQASVNLSGTSRVTLEFWLKWNNFANDDKLAFEFTSNFNNTEDGFLVNPDSSTSSSRFEVAMGRNSTRNSIYFTRPTAGVWHHYAFVFNASTFSPSITPYVDGKAVSFSKGTSGLGGGNFANSTLNFMSRNASSLFGAGSLDEVALYDEALSATQIAQHFAAR
jgi:YD repeat-containing protein